MSVIVAISSVEFRIFKMRFDGLSSQYAALDLGLIHGGSRKNASLFMNFRMNSYRINNNDSKNRKASYQDNHAERESLCSRS